IPSIEAQTPSRPSCIMLPPRTWNGTPPLALADRGSERLDILSDARAAACYRGGSRRNPMDRILIANASIFDGSGAAPFSGDVLVEGQRIAAVERGGGLPRNGVRVIDGAGATLMPGLVEPHGHLSYPDAASNADFTRLPPEEHVLITMRNARTILECGYTSV